MIMLYCWVILDRIVLILVLGMKLFFLVCYDVVRRLRFFLCYIRRLLNRNIFF